MQELMTNLIYKNTQSRWNSGPATKRDYTSVVQAHGNRVRKAKTQLQWKAANNTKTNKSSVATSGMKKYKESNGLVLNRAAGLVTDIKLMVSEHPLPWPWPAKCPRPLFSEAGLRKRGTTSTERRYRPRELAHIMVKVFSTISEIGEI